MAADPHPLFEVRLKDGRVERVHVGRSAGKLLVSLAVVALIAFLVAIGALSVDELLSLLPALPKF
jgi:hypothetical protein